MASKGSLPMIGKTLGHYRILEKIGAGGMGVVYRAHDERLDRDVALKVLPSNSLADEAARKRFRNEALALAKLSHPNIAAVYDVGEQDGVDYIVMECVPGETLSEKLKPGSLSEKDVVGLGKQIAAALEEAHERSIVHRDLKPGNILVTPKGQAKVLDFGLAKLLRPTNETVTAETAEQAQGLAGTLPYMAPEQLRGEPADARTDIWAVGAVLYEMATGRRPFTAKLATALAADIQHQPTAPPRQLQAGISARLEEIILKCLEKNAELRYRSARELCVELERLSVPGTAAAAVRPGGGRRAKPGRIRALAVLPLANLSGDAQQEYFADGMTEALITSLAQIGALRVISRTSVMRYKGAQKPLPEIAQELNVDAVVEGSVLRAGNRVRITGQLIDAASDTHLWAESYERDLSDILALQGEVARAIAQEIKVKLTAQEASRLARARRVNPQAYEAYLQGRYHLNRRTEGALKKSVECFEQAIAQDTNYAPGYSGLADALTLLGTAGYGGVKPPEVLPRAKAAAGRALELDEGLAEAHTSLAFLKFRFEWAWAEAEREFRRAIELNPNYATAHHWYALYLAALGRLTEAMAEIEKAQVLDPLSLIISSARGRILHFAHRYDEAVAQLQKTLTLDANFAQAHFDLSMAYTDQGKFREGIAEVQKAMELSELRPVLLSQLAVAYAGAGQRREAERVAEELKRLSSERNVSPLLELGYIYAKLGEKDQAFELLEKAYEERAGLLVYAKVESIFDSLRDDPRFQELLRRMNFPE